MDRGERCCSWTVGAECAGYAADITRTIPWKAGSLRASARIYDARTGRLKRRDRGPGKPGVTLARTSPDSLYRVAFDYIDSHGKDRQGNSLGALLIHGISHHIGLEVHDVGEPSVPLEPGMVISVEPGVYIPGEQLGIRIEDMVLVDGKRACEVLTAALPQRGGGG